MELRQIVENQIMIFDFEYPIFDETYKPVLEEKIINEFYFREIAFDTVGKFKFKLKTKLNKIMPNFNKMYKAINLEQRILNNYEVTETFTKEGTENITAGETANNKNVLLKSDTPSTRVVLSDSEYVSEIDENTETNTSTNTTEGNNTENWTRTMVGNIGVATDADAVMNFIQNLINVDQLIINELKDLFMQVY